eukprot:sb/3477256/
MDMTALLTLKPHFYTIRLIANSYFKNRSFNILHPVSYSAITQPFLDQFAKSWIHWEEDIEIFQMSPRKSKSAQIARLNGVKCAFSPLRRAICANFHFIELILKISMSSF